MRKAELADIPRIVEMGRKFHEASGQKAPFDVDALSSFLAGLINSDAGVIIIDDGGMIGGVISPAYCGPSWIMAVELFWWAEKGGIALLRGFEVWARESGANEIRMTSLKSLERAGRLLELSGYEPTEISYTKAV